MAGDVPDELLMNMVLLMMSRARAPIGGTWSWLQGQTGNRTVGWQNPNGSTMRMELGAWSDPYLSWVTSSPVVWNGNATAPVTANLSVSGSTITGDLAILRWSCEGDHGQIFANASYYGE